jgi:hypothetical protein
LSTGALVLIVSADAMLRSSRNADAVTAYANHAILAPGPGALHETALTQAIVVLLTTVGVWSLGACVLRRGEPRSATVALAMAIPALAYALGTFLTPIAFRPESVATGLGRAEALGPHVVELAVALGGVGLLVALVFASAHRTALRPG